MPCCDGRVETTLDLEEIDVRLDRLREQQQQIRHRLQMAKLPGEDGGGNSPQDDMEAMYPGLSPNVMQMSQEEAFNRIAQVFMEIDLDDSGSLSMGELSHFFRYLGLADTELVDALLKTMDADGDGEIDMEEWLQYLPFPLVIMILQITEIPGALAGYKAMMPLVNAFHQFDTDGSGTLSVEELQFAMQKMGLERSACDRAVKAMQEMDNDGNGEIDLMEWVQLVPADIREMIQACLNKDGLVSGFTADAV